MNTNEEVSTTEEVVIEPVSEKEQPYYALLSKLSIGQLTQLWTALAEDKKVRHLIDEDVEDEDPLLMAAILSNLIKDVPHVDVVLVATTMEDATILESLMSKPIHKGPQARPERHGPKPGKESLPRAKHEGSGPSIKAPKSDDNRIIATVKIPNPKREGSKAWNKYNHYEEGITVAEFLRRAGKEAAGDVKYDVEHGFITLKNPE